MGNERTVRTNGVDLCAESFGDPTDPAILLVCGAGASMDWWEEELCRRLAAGFRYVIRYDHRDTGRSVSYEPGAPPYTFHDLADDVVRLLDAYGLDAAHLVGVSMGGALAQLVALRHPDRVESLVLISTTPGSGGPELPAMSDELRTHFAAGPPDWSDRAAVLDRVVEGQRLLAARSRPFDETAVRDLAGRALDRTVNVASAMTNHRAAGRSDHGVRAWARYAPGPW